MTKKVCLVDGSGYIFRAFYALPTMTAPDGTPVNAVFGFTNMFMKLTSKISCDYCLVLFDAKRQNYRNEIFADYKGTRKETPEELIPQFPIIRQAVDVLSLNHLEMEGFEADDLIATYARLAVEKGYEVTIVSADKDLMQLIRPGVEYYDPMKDKFFTPEDVKEKFGVYPEKVVDVQALAGDTTDNIPGVPGIGLKTAAALVNEFGSLEGVLNGAANIKQEKRRQTLLENAENARISLKLVTLKDDVAVNEDFEAFRCRCPDAEVVQKFVSDYDFKSLKPRIEKWISERCADEHLLKPKAEIIKNYTIIDTSTKLKAFVDKICSAQMFVFKCFADGASPFFDKICGIALAYAPGEAAYVPLNHLKASENENFDLFDAPSAPAPKQLAADEVANMLKPLFEAKSILKIGHGIKTDIHFMTQILGKDVSCFPLEDVAVLSYDCDSSEHGHSILELSEIFLNLPLKDINELLKSGKNKILLSALEPTAVAETACESADYILRLYQILKPRLYQQKVISIYENFDRPLVEVLRKAEDVGIMVDAAALKDLSKDFCLKLSLLEQEIFQLAGEEFNIGSPKQIGEILFEKQGIKGKKTPTGAWQTGADVLEDLAEEGVEIAAKILDWRAISKLKSTYSDALLPLLDKEGRVHTTFSQTVVNTGRLASNNPNLQNIPVRSDAGKKIRACFVARPGYKLISCDYSQVELRLLAGVADVKGLKQAFAEGIDVHAATAAKVFGVAYDQVDADLRRHAKAINFGIVYGISAFGLAKQINVTPEEAKKYIDAYFAQMPEIKTYMEETIAFAKKHGYVLTPFGRRCFIGNINDQNKRVAQAAERAAINAPIQGGAADIIKLAMNKIGNLLAQNGLKTKMLLQVHDELVFEAPEEEVEKAVAVIKNCMENAADFGVPFNAEAGIGNNWAEAH